jgi:hypothetical protein
MKDRKIKKTKLDLEMESLEINNALYSLISSSIITNLPNKIRNKQTNMIFDIWKYLSAILSFYPFFF